MPRRRSAVCCCLRSVCWPSIWHASMMRKSSGLHSLYATLMNACGAVSRCRRWKSSRHRRARGRPWRLVIPITARWIASFYSGSRWRNDPANFPVIARLPPHAWHLFLAGFARVFFTLAQAGKGIHTWC
ncbi:hypothetical protein CBM2586_B10098 [Cupriavidus phytorum]|uniref:Transposase n=1 Tax=Cupriavidus taiwanensis TaxID=164546 RepID=A0A975XCA7_9BURK|nr:hypothetical protein CBM2586_B10098 [Cupriavidus taiwanensis]